MSELRVALLGPERPPLEWLDGIESEGQVRFLESGARDGCDVGLLWVELLEAQAREFVAEEMRRPKLPLVVAGQRPEDADVWVRRGVVLVLECGPDGAARDQLDLLRLASQIVPVARPRTRRRERPGPPRPAPGSRPRSVPLCGVVSSTGGPRALAKFLSALPTDLRGSVLIVQHLGERFLPSLQASLQRTTSLKVSIAQAGVQPRPGQVFLAPSRKHLVVGRSGRFLLLEDQEDSLHVPSGDRLLESVAETCGPCGTAIVLSGMGSDGAAGARAVHEAGGRVLVQSASTCVVPGMPRAVDPRVVSAELAPAALADEVARRFVELRGGE